MLLPSDRLKAVAGEDGPAFQGNFRKGELRGIIHINKDNCVGCDTCRKFCPVDAISGGLGAIHKIRDAACVSCGQCLSACPFGAIEQMSFVDDVIAALKRSEEIRGRSSLSAVPCCIG